MFIIVKNHVSKYNDVAHWYLDFGLFKGVVDNKKTKNVTTHQ